MTDDMELPTFERPAPGEHLAGTAGGPRPPDDVPVELAVEIGRTRMTVGATLSCGPARSSCSTAWPASRSTCSSTARRSRAARSS